MGQATRKHLYELLSDFDTAMLITHSRDGGLHARPMAVAELQADGNAYFVTRLDTPKVDEIESDADAALTFQKSNVFAAVYGRAMVVEDHARIESLWNEAWKVWFPEGKEDPALALLKFEADHGEYWDNTGVAGIKYVFEAAKAYAGGRTPRTDEKQHGKVDL